MEAKQTPVRIHRSDYAPFAWTVTTRLDVSIKSPDTLVSVTLDIQPNPVAKPSDELLLNGRGLSLLSIEVDGLHLAVDQYRLDSNQLRITGLTGQHQVKVTSTCTPTPIPLWKGYICQVICFVHNVSRRLPPDLLLS